MQVVGSGCFGGCADRWEGSGDVGVGLGEGEEGCGGLCQAEEGSGSIQ